MGVSSNFPFVSVLLVIALFPRAIVAQTEQNRYLQCSHEKESKNELKTYRVGFGIATPEDIKRIEEKWGKLTFPKGETKQAREASALRKRQIDVIQKSLEVWIEKHPNATKEEITQRRRLNEEALNSITKTRLMSERIALKKFDWREYLDVGPIMNQGSCNTCWAFTTTVAAWSSLQKNDFESQAVALYQPDITTGEMRVINNPLAANKRSYSPFVQDLLDCMPMKVEDICNSGWHGTAFDFMVYGKGVPMVALDGSSLLDKKNSPETVFRRVYAVGQKFACKPAGGFFKASAWDYVASPPDKLPTVEEMKTALIEHGPVVAPIAFDKCLADYRGGVFNEKNLGMVNHVVLLIGWDDDKEAWLIKNSWGEEWGEKGFGWVKYGSNNIGLLAAWIDTGYYQPNKP